MSEEDRLKLENELLLTKSKAQMINLYLDLQQKVDRLNNIINGLEKYLIEMSDRSWDDNGAYDDALDKLKELAGTSYEDIC